MGRQSTLNHAMEAQELARLANCNGTRVAILFLELLCRDGMCGDKVVNGNEQCEAAGGGTSIYDRYNCSACKWTADSGMNKNGNERATGKSCKNCQRNCRPEQRSLSIMAHIAKSSLYRTQTVDVQ